MPLTRAAAFITVTALSLAAAATASQTTLTHSACGTELWDLKTLSDARRALVYLRPRPTTVAAINARPMPRRTPTVRSRGFERHVWRLKAQITNYKLEQDGDIHMILFNRGAYMIAEMPSEACLPRSTRDRGAIINTRRLFESRCGAATIAWRSLGAVVYVSIGFWDSRTASAATHAITPNCTLSPTSASSPAAPKCSGA